MSTIAPIKITLFGPESTGKTYLAQYLAGYFNTVWVPEYARTYLESKKKYYDFYSKGSDEICTQEDILPIVLGQIATEDTLMPHANKCMFLDTNPLQTKVYVSHYYNAEYAWLTRILEERPYDYYLLTDIDIPWEPDPLRDRSDNREGLYDLFKKELLAGKINFGIISGPNEERLKNAVQLVKNFCIV